jgi:hypothetical protein
MRGPIWQPKCISLTGTTICFAYLALAAAVAIPVAAHADTYNFTLTYYNYDSPGQTEIETFSLPSSPTPDCSVVSNCDADRYFILDNVANNIAGDPDPTVDGPGTTTVTFFTADAQNIYFDFGFSFNDDLGGVVSYVGPLQYFTGSVSSPTFTPGTYEISYSQDGSLDGTISIVDATPEPSSLMLLGTGMLGLAGTVCRRIHA